MEIECRCSNCGRSFLKAKNEYDRRIKKGKTAFFCSLKCSGESKENRQHFERIRCKVPIRDQPNFKDKELNPFKYYLRNCKRRNQHNFDLDLEYLKELWEQQKGICPYIKVELKLNSDSKRVNDFRYSASLDRIDSNQGYIKGNVQFISTSINLMKNNLTHEQTLEFIKIIANSVS